MKINQVYRCPNKECRPYHFKDTVLLDVNFEGKRYSIDTSLPYFQYASGTFTLTVAQFGNGYYLAYPVAATCYHCNGPAELAEVEHDPETDKQDAMKKLDDCESRIAKLMEQLK